MNAVFGEPLLGDERIARIEQQIRKEYPRLPEYCTFVSYVQEPLVANVRGIDIQLPRTAVLAILVTNARHPDSMRIFRAGEPLESWRAREWFTRHDSDVRSDPAYLALKKFAPEIIEWDSNLKAMLN